MQSTSYQNAFRLSSLLLLLHFSSPPANKYLFLFLDLLPTHCKKTPPCEMMTSCSQPISLYGAIPGVLPALSAFSLTWQTYLPSPCCFPAEGTSRVGGKWGGQTAQGEGVSHRQRTDHQMPAPLLHLTQLRTTKAPLPSMAGRMTLSSEHFKTGNTSHVT